MLAAGWLQEAHEVYVRFEMRDEAEQLLSDLERASAGIEKELIHVSHGTTIPKDELEKAIGELVSGTKDGVLFGLAANFLPKVADAEKLVKEIAAKAVFMKVSQQIVVEGGRVEASIGPVDEDFDGHVILQMGRSMQFFGQLFRPTIEAAIARCNLSTDDILTWLGECPLFTPNRLKLLEPALRAYFDGNWAMAIHLTIPQIEQALRQVLVLCGEPLIRPHRNGTFLLKNLDEVAGPSSREGTS